MKLPKPFLVIVDWLIYYFHFIFKDILQNNINMMENTMDLVEDFVNFGTKQVSLVFGEDSALSRLIIGGFGPLLENIDSIFNALESLISFKRNILDTFLSDNYDRDKLLRKFSINFTTYRGPEWLVIDPLGILFPMFNLYKLTV